MKTLPIKQKNRIPWWGIGLIAGGLILTGMTVKFFIDRRINANLNITELTESVSTDNLAVRIKASGKVEPIRSVNISSKNPGRLIKLLVEQGDRVTQGQAIGIMENEEIAAQKSQSEAQLQQTIANLQRTEISLQGNIEQAEAQLNQVEAQLKNMTRSIPKDIAQAQAQLQSAQAQNKLTSARTKRNNYLLEQGAISQDTFDEAVNENSNAEARALEMRERLSQIQAAESLEIQQMSARVREARSNLEIRKKGYQSEIKALQADVNAARANLTQNEVQFDNTVVKAPFAGIITQRFAVEGSFVTPSTSASSSASASATSIVALAEGLEIIAKVPEVDIGQLELRQKVEIVADAYPDQIFEGEIKRIAPEAIIEDNVTSFEVRIDLLTGKDKLRSKMNVDVAFIGQEITDTLVVPTVSIVTEDGKTGVMKLNAQDKPEFVPVTIGIIIKDKTQILNGIDSGDRVFIDLPEENNRKKEKEE